MNLVKRKREMFFITGPLTNQQTELRNCSPEIGSKEVKEKWRSGL
jgi:hypothetical protein